MSASHPFFALVGQQTISLEQKFKWLSFPGLIRGIAVIHFFVYILLVLKWEAINGFVYDEEKFRAGEYWRILSFLAIPPILPTGLISTIFMFFLTKISFMINDAFEQHWGAFRTSVYVYATLACIILSTLLFGGLESSQGGMLYTSAMFVSFATRFPRVEFLLMFILPVQVWVLGAIFGAITIIGCIKDFDFARYTALAFLPYLIWAVPLFWRTIRDRSRIAAHKSAFRDRSLSAGPAFHKCETCGATDASHPDRHFRVTEDHHEICDTCLDKDAESDEPARETP
jgi:hypothetical protein